MLQIVFVLVADAVRLGCCWVCLRRSVEWCVEGAQDFLWLNWAVQGKLTTDLCEAWGFVA